MLVEDETGDVTLVFFNAQRRGSKASFRVGERRFVSGTIELCDGMRQMVHPDRILDERGAARPAPGRGGLRADRGRLLAHGRANTSRAALTRCRRCPNGRMRPSSRATALPPSTRALNALHRPDAAGKLTEEALERSPARRRLAYDELLASQLALALVRSRMRRLPGRANAGDGRLVAAIQAALPFGLTRSQERPWRISARDLVADTRMLRLLQGDVGSGKTVVALLAMASAIEAGRQAALMAPTEILARQHFERLAPLAEAAGLRIALLTGRDKGAERRTILAGLAEGAIDIVVGTHALFQDEVAFHDLGLAVVDEQHRFGVHQRLALGAKGEAVDILVMTATPIPRTLALTYFGDMDVSVLREKPAGRQPVATRLVSIERLDEVVARARARASPPGIGSTGSARWSPNRRRRPRRRGGPLRAPAPGLRRRGRSRPRPDAGRDKDAAMDALRPAARRRSSSRRR